MLGFRSEASVDRWCEVRKIARGATLTIEQTWELGRAWYANKLSADWRRATPEEAESTFARIGLTGSFWQLTGSS